jgi:hypothetical protein
MSFSMEEFNINELAGATGLILGAVGGILAIIFKSRCYCKFRIGISDKWNLCMCERKPPPDPNLNDSDDETNKIVQPPSVSETSTPRLIPKKNNEPKIQIKIEEEKSKDKDSKLDDLL